MEERAEESSLLCRHVLASLGNGELQVSADPRVRYSQGQADLVSALSLFPSPPQSSSLHLIFLTHKNIFTGIFLKN